MASGVNEGLRFANKVAIVTGGCDGIGRACVDALAASGGKVAVFDITDEKGEKLKAGKVGEIFYIHCDMREEDQIKNAIQKTIERFGQLDCLVNNVGTVRSSDTQKIDDLTVEGFKELFNINVVSAFTASKYSLPYLRRTQGSIINLSSIMAVQTTKCFSTYCSTKGAIRSFTKALANDEGEHGVRVNCIAPGCVTTPLNLQTHDERTMQLFASSAALNRLCAPEEVGKMCLFLATDANYTTGSELMCNGGMDMKVGVRVEGNKTI